MNIEEKVADAILQRQEDVVISGVTYHVAKPSVATLILVSECVSKMPNLRLSEDSILKDSLRAAKDCRIVGEIIATLILGAKGLTETREARQIEEKRRFWGLWTQRSKVEKEEIIDRKKELTQQILEDLSPRELTNLTNRLLQGMQIADFFALTTFLTEINLLQQTKVVNGTTASGQ